MKLTNKEELYALRTQRTEASSKIAHLDVEVSELKMAAESSKVSYFVQSLDDPADFSSMKTEQHRRFRLLERRS